MAATAKLFTHGGSQAVRLPKAFRFEGTEVSVRKEGDAVSLDAIRGDAPPMDYPPRDDLVWPDPPNLD